MSFSKREFRVLKCPFCRKGDIEITYMPPTTKAKKGSWGGSKAGITAFSDQTVIHTERCPECGKSREEIRKNLKGEEKIDHKKVIERMKKQGLPTQIEF